MSAIQSLPKMGQSEGDLRLQKMVIYVFSPLHED